MGFRRYQSAFTAGVLDEALRGRRDTTAYYIGCEELENVLTRTQGPAVKRPAIQHLFSLSGAGRVLPFVYSDTQAYAVVLTNANVAAYAVPGETWIPVNVAATMPAAHGVALGSFESYAGLEGLYDGRFDLPAVECSVAEGTLIAYAGKDWGEARQIKTCNITGPNDAYIFSGENGATVEITLQGSTDNFVSDINTIGTGSTTTSVTDVNDGTVHNHAPTGTINSYRYTRVKVEITGVTSTGDIRLAGVRFFTGNSDGEVVTAHRHALVTSTSAVFLEAELPAVDWTNVADVLLLAHPNHPLQELARAPDGTFSIAAYDFEAPPQHKYHTDAATTINPSATSGNITLAAADGSNNNVFVDDHVGTIWEIGKKRVTITAVNSATSADATVIDTLSSSAKTTDWTEQAASAVRGYFRSVAYHQGRLCLGGTRDAPFQIWMSRTDAPYDFQRTTTDDDAPIYLTASTGRGDAIRYLISGSGGLEVFMGGYEGYIPGSPVTPSNVAFRQQSAMGSQRIKPVRLDSQTIFLQQGASTAREWTYSDVEQAYQPINLSVRAETLLPSPISMTMASGAFNLRSDFLIVANDDGTLATMTSNRAEQVTAWTKQTSTLDFTSVTSILNEIYCITKDAAGRYDLGFMTYDSRFDAGKTETHTTAVSAVYGAYHLRGQVVDVFADGYWRGSFTVSASGSITFGETYNSIEYGYLFSPRIRPMPPEAEDQSLLGRPIRPIKCELRYRSSAGIKINDIAVPDRPFDDVINTAPQEQTKTSRVYLRGWSRENVQAPVITQDGPFNFEVSAMLVDYEIGGGL